MSHVTWVVQIWFMEILVVDAWIASAMHHHMCPSFVLANSLTRFVRLRRWPEKNSSLASAASRARRCMHGASSTRARKRVPRQPNQRWHRPRRCRLRAAKMAEAASFKHQRHHAFTPPRTFPSPNNLARLPSPQNCVNLSPRAPC